MNLYYAVAGGISREPHHKRMLSFLDTFDVNILYGTRAVRLANGMIADLSKTDDRTVEKVLKANELGQKVLILANRQEARGLPSELVGISKVNPNGVRYSDIALARSAVKVFMWAHYGLESAGTPNVLDLTEEQHAARTNIGAGTAEQEGSLVDGLIVQEAPDVPTSD
jgi:hypothetical protein